MLAIRVSILVINFGAFTSTYAQEKSVLGVAELCAINKFPKFLVAFFRVFLFASSKWVPDFISLLCIPGCIV